MAMNRTFIATGLLLAGLALASTGCSRQARAERRLAQAARYSAANQPDWAERELRAALELAPDDPKIVARLALFYYDKPRYDLAAPCLARARDMDPDNLEIRIKLAELLMARKQFREARSELFTVLEKNPAHEEALISLAETAVLTNEIAEIRERLDSCLQRAGDRAVFHLAFATLHNAAGASALVRTELDKALELDPKSSRVHIALGNLDWSRRDFTNAESHFQTARAFEPPGSPQLLRLVDFKIRSGGLPEAKNLLSEILAHHPLQVGALRRWAAIALEEDRDSDCESAVQKILAMDPDHLEALLLAAQLQLKRGDLAQGIPNLESLSLRFPASAQVHYQLGLAYLQNHDAAKALASLNQAVSIDPAHIGASIEFAQLMLRQGQYAAVLDTLSLLLRRYPNLWQAELLVAQAHQRRGAPADALDVYERLAKLAPGDPRVSYLTGVTLRSMGRLDEARKALQLSLDADPSSLMVLSELAELELAARQPRAAIDLVRKHIEKNPSSSAHRVLLAELYYVQKDLAQTETVLMEALEKTPDSIGAYMFLARLRMDDKHYAQALERLQAALAKSPDNVNILMQLALLHQATKNTERARDTLERLLRINPRFAPALREMAEIFARQPGELERAWDFARRAREAAPADPFTAHTLGWILFQRRDYSWALNFLQESAAQRPNDPELQYHCGRACYMTGEETLARAAFDRALASPFPFAQTNDARRWLAFLDLDPARAAPSARAILEQRLAEEPNDPVALRRMSEIYRLQGQTTQSTALYEKALQANPRAVLPVLQLAKHHFEQLHDPAKAMEYARRAYTQAPEDPRVIYEVGRIALAVGDADWALGLFRESARRMPANPEVLFDFGQCALCFGRIAEASQAVRQALQAGATFSRTNEARVFLEMLDLCQAPARAAAAAARVAEVLQASPGLLPARMALGLGQEHRLETAAAIRTYETLLAPTNFPAFLPAARQLALIYAAHGQEEARALEFARRAHESDPQDTAITRALAKLHFRRGEPAWTARLLEQFVLGQPGDQEARFYLTRAQALILRDAPARPPYPPDVQAAKTLSQAAYQAGNYSWTADLLAGWRRSNLSDPDLWFYLGLAQARMSLATDARESLTRALSLDSKHPLAAEAKLALAGLQ